MTARGVVLVALALAALVAMNACLRVVDLTPARMGVDAGSNATPTDSHVGSDGETPGGDAPVDFDAGFDDGGGLPDGGVGLDA